MVVVPYAQQEAGVKIGVNGGTSSFKKGFLDCGLSLDREIVKMLKSLDPSAGGDGLVIERGEIVKIESLLHGKSTLLWIRLTYLSRWFKDV